VSSYDGGKGGAGVWQWIVNQMPPHETYVEAFLGDGAVLRHKRPARRTIGIEINPAVVETRWANHGLPGTTIVCGDALVHLDWDWAPDTFIYLDPPYLMETRSSQRQLYQFELAERAQHLDLLALVKRLPCMMAISGYWSALYEQELAGWRTSSFWTVNRAGTRVQEWLWMNYPPPLELHDYRYLGRNFRERERIKRKTQRWTARLRTMPDLERYALMEAIGTLRSSISPDVAVAAGITENDDIDEPTLEIVSPGAAMGAPIAACDEGIPSPDLAIDAGDCAIELAPAETAMPPAASSDRAMLQQRK